MGVECTICAQLWRLYARDADALSGTGAELQTAGSVRDHKAVKSGIKKLQSAAHERADGSGAGHGMEEPRETGVEEDPTELSKASRILGIDRSTLYSKLRRYGSK